VKGKRGPFGRRYCHRVDDLLVRRPRVDPHCAHLRDTDKTITRIAFLVGFEDSAYFTRAFKRLEGLSPKAYSATVNRVIAWWTI
jgi:AraC-like DNA-binding protein